VAGTQLLVCSVCKQKFKFDGSRTNTYRNHSKKHLRCNKCSTNVRRKDLKKRAVVYKGGKCIGCGYNKCKKALTFHHLNPKKKRFNIARASNYSWEKLKPELDKCVLLCSNCHIEVHAGIRRLKGL